MISRRVPERPSRTRLPAECGHPFTHAGEAVAFATIASGAVIFDLEPSHVVRQGQADPAGFGPRVAQDVRGGFAQDHGQCVFVGGGQGEGFGLNRESDARGFEGLAHGFELGGETRGAVAGDGASHLGEGVARHFVDLADLLGRSRGVAFHELAREFGLERDDGEGVAEHVVEVARDPLAFRDLGQVFDFAMSQPKPCIRQEHLSPVDVEAADDAGDEDRGNEEPQLLPACHAERGYQAQINGEVGQARPITVDERDHRRGVDEETRAVEAEGCEREGAADEGHPRDHQNEAPSVNPISDEIQNQESDVGPEVSGKLKRPLRILVEGDQIRDGVQQPRVGRPTELGVGGEKPHDSALEV